ncbi:MAG: hypothetical protein AABZ74_13760 [Cyanobacteriota bacterium]
MSEVESILVDKQLYIKLKKMADANECSVNEEIGKAFTAIYDDLDESCLEEIDIMPRKDTVYLLLPENLYNLLQEEAESNETDIEKELNLFFDEYLSSSEEDEPNSYEEEDDSEEIEEDGGSEGEGDEDLEIDKEYIEDNSDEESEEIEEEGGSEGDEESEEENSEKRSSETNKSKGLFDIISDAVEDFVQELISDEKEPEKKKKKN